MKSSYWDLMGPLHDELAVRLSGGERQRFGQKFLKRNLNSDREEMNNNVEKDYKHNAGSFSVINLADISSRSSLANEAIYMPVGSASSRSHVEGPTCNASCSFSNILSPSLDSCGTALEQIVFDADSAR
ncbi:hypothetical protein RRG08_062566 [Elysia crispata]|uniref:Uncharacterized protein n=1 Tax=Elysia crispata TaxID=231223 RepID=A0AAE1APC0_9GAST|nr:hypothetical protein RRG08_062566 [Elysia crispata]